MSTTGMLAIYTLDVNHVDKQSFVDSCHLMPYALSKVGPSATLGSLWTRSPLEITLMARKKTEIPKMTAAEPKVRPVRLDLSPEEHRALRVKAAQADMSMAAFVRMVVLREIEAKK